MRRNAVNARDAGVALIGRINRWLIAGAVVVTGTVSLAAARSFHGHTTASSSSSSRGTSSSSSSSSLQQPSQAPAPSSAPQSTPAPVVSGGS